MITKTTTKTYFDSKKENDATPNNLIKPCIFYTTENEGKIVEKTQGMTQSQENRPLIKPVVFDRSGTEKKVDSTQTDLVKPAIFKHREQPHQPQQNIPCTQLLNKESTVPLNVYTLLNFDITDVGNFERFQFYYGDIVKYDCTTHMFLIWNGTYWEVDKENKTLQMCKKVLSTYRSAAKNFQYSENGFESERFRHSQSSCNSDKINALKNIIKISCGVKHDIFDTHSDLLNVQNGVVNLRTGELLKHDKKYFFTNCIEVDYRQDCNFYNSCFWKFIVSIACNDLDLIEYLHTIFGYGITGEIKEQAMFIMHGTGSNGKTTLIEAIGNVLKPHVVHLPIDIITGRPEYRNPGKASPEIAQAEKARMVFTSESNEHDFFNEGKVKNLTGGGTISARRLYQAPIEFQPTFKIFIDTNHFPSIKGNDFAIWRRIQVVPFRATFNAETMDKDLPQKLQTQFEKERILHWLITGAFNYYKEGIKGCAAVQTATFEYKNSCDSIGRFLIECIQIKNNSSIPASKLYEFYKKFCSEADLSPVSEKEFGSTLPNRGIKKLKTRNGMLYQDISVQGVQDV